MRRGIHAVRRRLSQHRSGSSESPLPTQREHDAQRLLAASLFDREWYEAQTGVTFSDDAGAIDHYLTVGRRTGFSPNVLFEPAWFAPRQWDTMGEEPLLRYLRIGAGQRGVHPLFDEGAHTAEHAAAVGHPGGALGHFLATATDRTPVPVPDTTGEAKPTWGAVRRRLLRAAHEYAASERLMQPRWSYEWDTDREANFLARWMDAPLPTRADGPLVSVVLPVRNRPSQVGEAIQSVRHQSLDSWELVVVDDGSTDETPDVVAAIAADDRRVRLLRREHGGVCAARNTALDAARGRYVAFLDSDNEWQPHHLRAAVAAMHGLGVRAAYCGVERDAGDERRFFGFEGTVEDLLFKNYVDLNALVVDRDVAVEAGGFDDSLRRWVDHDFALRVASRTELAFLPFIGVRYDDDKKSADRISVVESPAWAQVVLGKHLVDWSAAGTRDRAAGRTSVLVDTGGGWTLPSATVRRAVETARGDDVEIVVVDSGSRRSTWTLLNAMSPFDCNIEFVRMPRRMHRALALNVAAARASGERLMLLDHAVTCSSGWATAIAQALREPEVAACQLLALAHDGTVASAGWAFPGGDAVPAPFLRHHPVTDVPDDGWLDIPAASGVALAVRAADFIAVGGLDPFFSLEYDDVDLCLRLTRAHGGRCVVVTDSTVTSVTSSGEEVTASPYPPIGGRRYIAALSPQDDTEDAQRAAIARARSDDAARLVDRHRGLLPAADAVPWTRTGFAVHSWHAESVDMAVTPRRAEPVLTRGGSATHDRDRPSLRWAIKIAAPTSERGDQWGDVHFAADLAAALRRLGQDVVVDRREAHQRPTSYLDDVTLTLRGLDAFAPQPAAINLLWVISHPELVTADEIRRYDAAFAAGVAWSHTMSESEGVNLIPLLQATDPTRFHPSADSGAASGDVVFIGKSRGEYRTIVRDAIAAGIDVRVYGPDWDDFLDPAHIAGSYVPNDALPQAYREASVVLNDHWSDMRRTGFVSNRLFDAVAAGARVVSDDIAGVDELFGGAVQVYSSADDLARLCAGHGFPAHDRLAKASQHVREHHSFDARAATLLETAVRIRQDRAEAQRA